MRLVGWYRRRSLLVLHVSILVAYDPKLAIALIAKHHCLIVLIRYFNPQTNLVFLSLFFVLEKPGLAWPGRLKKESLFASRVW